MRGIVLPARAGVPGDAAAAPDHASPTACRPTASTASPRTATVTCGSPPATAWRATTASASASGAPSRACATTSSGRCTWMRATASGSAPRQAGLAMLDADAQAVPLLQPRQHAADRQRQHLVGDVHARRRDLVRHRVRRPAPARRRRHASPASCRAPATRAACPTPRVGAVGGRARRQPVGRHQGRRRALDRTRLRARAGRALSSPLINGLTRRTRRHAVVRHAARRQRAPRRRPLLGRRRGATRASSDTILHVLLRDRSGKYWFDIPQGLGRDERRQGRVVPLYSAAAQGLVRPSWVGALRGPRRRPVVRQQQQRPVVPAGELAPVRGAVASPRRRRRRSPMRTCAASRRRPTATCGWSAPAACSTGSIPTPARSQHVCATSATGYVLSTCSRTGAGMVWVELPRTAWRASIRPPAQVQRWNARRAAPMPHWPATVAASCRPRRHDLAGDRGRRRAGARRRRPRAMTSMVRRRARPAGRASSSSRSARGPTARCGSPARTACRVECAARAVSKPCPARRTTACTASPSMPTAASGWPGSARSRPIAGMARRCTANAHRRATTACRACAQRRWRSMAPACVWLTSVRGLIRVDPARRAVRVYGVRDGLPSQEFDDAPGACAAATAASSVGSAEGPGAVRSRRRCSPTRSAPHAGDRIHRRPPRRRAHRRFVPARPFDIRHDDRDLRIVARLLSFNDARNHAYRFRLAGYDPDWVDVGSAGERIFSQLQARAATACEVQARTADNVWSQRADGRLHRGAAVVADLVRPSPASPAWRAAGLVARPTAIAGASSAATPGSWPSRSANSPSRPRWRRPASSPRSATKCARR